MKIATTLAAISLTSSLLALDAAAVSPGRPDAPTRGISAPQTESQTIASTERKNILIGRPEAFTRGIGVGETGPATRIADKLAPEQKPGRPEYHTRGIYCSHRGKNG